MSHPLFHRRLAALVMTIAAIALPAAATNSGGGLSAYEPGLFYGSISQSGISYAAPAATNHVLGAEMVYKSPWGSNITYAYWGEIYLDGSDYRFSSRIDDAFSLSIAGRTITGGASVKYLDLTGLAAGWYPFEYRVYNGGGGYGGWAGYVKNNLTATHTGTSYTTFSKLLDPGDMSLFRHRCYDGLDVVGTPGEYGGPTPAYGRVGHLSADAVLSVSCPAVCTNQNATLRAFCTGWKLYDAEGDVVSNGAENAFTYVHPSPATYRRLEWQWRTERLRYVVKIGDVPPCYTNISVSLSCADPADDQGAASTTPARS
ncbi:MAG: hypothetical protein IJQ73_18395 [Kiritimatiellae bacterium]|nr:hypothetical protein [Kiritimatiellia bacterium]